MIETSEILDLTDGTSAERSNDDQHAHQAAVLGSGHPHLPGRQPNSNGSPIVNIHNIAEMTPKEEPNANSMQDVDFKDVKSGFEELCPVCGDKVSGYHYGLLTCESCKGFFKRTVQNKKVYSCVDNRNCQIDKSQRKRCPYCRFQKCLSVGMKLEAVRSDRMRGGRNKFGPMYKRDRALKQQAARHANAIHGSCGDIPLMTNGMMGGGAPGSPEDVKPDPLLLQASLNLYSGSVSTSTTSNLIQGLIPGLNCLSASAVAPSSSASIASSSGGPSASSSSPPPVHPHHMSHNHHSSHQGLAAMSAPAQGFTQNYGHVSTLTVPQPHSPKTHYQQHTSHHNNQHMHQHQQHTGSSPMERGSPPSHHQQQVSPHLQALADVQMQQSHGLQHNLGSQHRQNPTTTTSNNNNNNISSLASAVRENEANFPTSSQVHPNVIEALRAFQGPAVSGQSERSVLTPLMAEIKATMVDETEVKHKMLNFMQNELSQTDISSSPEQFLPVLCRMVDQLLFLMVEWARNSSFFKEIKVEDQMKLLHNSWSEILILDFIYRQIHNLWGKEIVTPNGPNIGFEILDKLGLGDVKAKVFELVKKGRELKMDFNEYMCLKFLILLNPDVSSLENRGYIEQSQEKVNVALFEYCLLCYPEMADKFSQLLMRLPEIRLISIRTEDFLYFKHLSNEVPDQTLLTEMLHAKRRG